MEKIKLVDKYITRQLIETFLLGIVVFTSLMFASDTLLTLVKQISTYGIPVKVAFLIVILKFPSILVLTIPMGVLLSTIMTFNKLSINSEISVMRACGISIQRLALPVIIFGTVAAFLSFVINEFVAPAANAQARSLTVWALGQKNIPDGRTNFSFKELDNRNQLKRLIYVDSCNNRKLKNVTVYNIPKQGNIQIIHAKYGITTPEYWNLYDVVTYTISEAGNTLNTALSSESQISNNFSMFGRLDSHQSKELNFLSLIEYIQKQKKEHNPNLAGLIIELYEKISIPVTSIALALIGVPLAIAPPRARFNRGFMFCLLILFCYYILRAVSVGFGETNQLDPVLAAWLPDIVITTVGGILLYRKAYLT